MVAAVAVTVAVSCGEGIGESSVKRFIQQHGRASRRGSYTVCVLHGGIQRMPKLIMLRGPSAVGKSTVAGELMRRTKRPTVLIDLDYYRFGFVNWEKAPASGSEDELGPEYEMSGSDVLIGLRRGYDVIFDGNFTSDPNDPFLKMIFDAHPDDNYLFYMDASLEETLKRHKTKENARIDTDKMREVYEYASPVGLEKEVIIPQDSSLEETVERIRQVAGI
jgi:predicted kinase